MKLKLNFFEKNFFLLCIKFPFFWWFYFEYRWHQYLLKFWPVVAFLTFTGLFELFPTIKCQNKFPNQNRRFDRAKNSMKAIRRNCYLKYVCDGFYNLWVTKTSKLLIFYDILWVFWLKVLRAFNARKICGWL